MLRGWCDGRFRGVDLGPAIYMSESDVDNYEASGADKSGGLTHCPCGTVEVGVLAGDWSVQVAGATHRVDRCVHEQTPPILFDAENG